MVTSGIVPHDDALPSLATVLDEQAMLRVFQQHLAARNGGEIEVAECRIERIKYRPRRNCIVGYHLKLRDISTQIEQRLCVGTYTAAEAHARYQKAVGEADFATSYFDPVTFFQSLNTVVWAFPNERKLSALPLLSDAAQLRERILPDVVRERWGDGWEIIDSSSEISNYFPEHTCCVSVTLALSRADNGEYRTWEIIGKTRYDDAGAKTHRCMEMLWQRQDADVSYARPLYYQPEHRLGWQERVPGVTLHSLLVSGIADNAVLIRVARAVAALHATPLSSECRVTLGDLLDHLKAAKGVIAEAHPNCANALGQTIDTLINSAGRLDVRYDGTWHGDLHSNNILVSDTQIHLVDMDRVSIGPPLADLGSFLAELIYRRCLNGESLEGVLPTVNTIVEAYRQRVTWPVSEKDVAWFTASALIHERALRCVTSLKPVRRETMNDLVAAAARIAEGCLFVHRAKAADGPAGESLRAA
jgi:aminoglycoside phosphotransferase (APT) family kinase protein